MYYLYNKIVTYTTGSIQIATPGPIYWNTACAAIMTSGSVKGTGSFIDGGEISLADLTTKKIYPFRLSYMNIDSGSVYLLY